MKRITIGIFEERADAEKAINYIHNELGVETDDISYVYKNTNGEVKEVDAADVTGDTIGESAAKGAVVGGTIGALAGIAALAGVIPIIGPLFAAGPLAAALGLSGAIGTTAAGAATGAAAGGIAGALINWGIGEKEATQYADSVERGGVLVAVHADEEMQVERSMKERGAGTVDVYAVSI